MRKLKKYLRENSYLVVLAIVTTVVVVVHIAFNDAPIEVWLKQSSASLFITIVGIWITVLCIDQIIRKKEQREKSRLLNITYLEISRALNFYLYCLDRIYVATSKEKPQFKETYREMYNSEHFREAFLNCDFMKTVNYQNCSWGQFINFKTKEFIDNIDNIILKYSFVLDADTLSMLEMLKGSSWILVYSHLEKPEGKRDVIYNYYNEFLCRLFVISDILTTKSNNPRYGLKYSQDIWKDEPFDKMGSARFDSDNTH